MTEQEQVIELIARQLCEDDNWKWEELTPEPTHFFSGKTRWEYLRRADQIHAIYKEAGYMKLDKDQSVPKELVSCGFSCEKLLKDWRKVGTE